MFQPASEFLPLIDEVGFPHSVKITTNLVLFLSFERRNKFLFGQVYRSLIEITKGISGAKVENNKFCVSVHYRNVDDKVTPSQKIKDCRRLSIGDMNEY